MRILSRVMLAMSLMLPLASQATQQWSSCQTITSVSNYMAYNSDSLLILSFSPGITGCTFNGTSGAVGIEVGQFGVTASNINTFLAGTLTAYSTGHQVMVYYDTDTCFGIIVANGGYGGACP
jgi:hypothetical protein